MTDKELLELAAKAAFGEFGKQIVEGGWNPLTDDGDALRLAVKCLGVYMLKYSSEDWEYCKQDGYAATRRAIVRAAAAIGEMK